MTIYFIGLISQSAFFDPLMFMLMLAGGSMAAPIHGGFGDINHAPSLLSMKSWTHSIAVQLSKIVAETQMDFVSTIWRIFISNFAKILKFQKCFFS